MDNETLLSQSTATVQEAAKLIGGTFEQGVGFKAGSSPTSNVLDSEALANVTPRTIPTTNATAAGELSATAQAAGQSAKEMSAFETQLATDSALARKDLEASRKSKQSLQESLLGTFEDIPRMEEEAGISEKAKRATEYTNQLEALERAEINAIRKAESEGVGMSASALQKSVQRIQRDYAFQKADVALLQSAANRDLVTAQSIVDRKVQLKLEPLKLRLDFATEYYNENKEAFSKAEDRAFSYLLNQENREYEAKVRTETQIENIAMQAAMVNASPSVIKQISGAKSVQEAINVGGASLGAGFRMQMESHALDLKLKNAQIAKIDLETSLIGQPTAAELKAEREAMQSAEKAIPLLNNKITLFDTLMKSNALDSVVGTSFLTRTPSGIIGKTLATLSVVGAPSALGGTVDQLTGERQSFIAGVEQLISKEFLDNLIVVKGQGATFGALDKGEREALVQAATKIGNWRIRKGDSDTGKIIGYDASEKAFKAELNILKDLTRTALTRAQGDILSTDERSLIDSLYESNTINPSFYFN